MAKREWKHLDQNTIYVLSAGNGWALSMNGDGTVNLAYTGTASEVSGVDFATNPDPGTGNKNPPTE